MDLDSDIFIKDLLLQQCNRQMLLTGDFNYPEMQSSDQTSNMSTDSVKVITIGG